MAMNGQQNTQGATIVLLHGIQGTARTWDEVAKGLNSTHRIVAPNLRGRANAFTPDAAGEYRLEDFASDLNDELAKLDHAPFVVAWSMGVSVVLTLLRINPGLNIRGLVFVSGSACVGEEAVWFHSRTMGALVVEAEERRRRLALSEAATSVAVAASWRHVMQADLRPVLDTVSCPTLVIHGAEDDQCPVAHGRLIADRIPQAEFDEWERTGHNPMAADADRFSAAIRDFVASVV
jgi:pimeloyl-ACP methyl ester carboxylesterase